MVPAIYIFAVVAGLVASQKTCPDGSLCNTGDTCCKLRSGKYTCCPLPNAVCCKDQEHCCPSGYLCDNETDACKPPGAIGAADVEFLSQPFGNSNIKLSRLNYVLCGDHGEAACPSSHTCCTKGVETAANHSCCPSKDAVCCADGNHCCPQGTTCDSAAARCVYDEAFKVAGTSSTRPRPLKPLKKQVTSMKTVLAQGFKASNCISGPAVKVSECPAEYYQCPDSIYCCRVGCLCTFDGACVPKQRHPRAVLGAVVP